MNATRTQVWAAATLILLSLYAVDLLMMANQRDLLKEIRKHDNRTDYVNGYWKGGTLYLSHEDYLKFENLRTTGTYPVKEFER